MKEERNLFIKDLIRKVHTEIFESQKEREAAGQSPLFRVEKMTIEVNFVVTETGKGRGGFDFKVITAGAEKEFQKQQVQKITLELGTFASTEPLSSEGESPWPDTFPAAPMAPAV